MAESVRDFYDELAGEYDMLYEDWDASIARQAGALQSILKREIGSSGSKKILDCACGIGTQAIGLATIGFLVTGADVSPRAIARADKEMTRRGLTCALYVADMRELSQVPETGFDAVICMDNALPHLFCEEQLSQAAAGVRAKLRLGGLFMASIRDYDQLIQKRPAVQGPAFFSDAGRRRIVFQLWDWIDERRYRFHLYITRETPEGWQTYHGVSDYRAVLREELTRILENVGFVSVRWLLPLESGFHQPLILGFAGEKAKS